MDKQFREPIPKHHQCITEVLNGNRDEHVRKANQEKEGNQGRFETCEDVVCARDVDGQS